MATKLATYNGALRLVGSRPLASLTEDREPRRVIDAVWNDALLFCLGEGLWNFAMRAIEASSAASIEPAFAFQYAYTKPNDWVRTGGVFSDQNEGEPLTDYVDEQGYWYANLSPIYVRFVSSDDAYGLDVGKWPPSFAEYVKAHIAAEICQLITESKAEVEQLRKLEHYRLQGAKNNDAMNEAARFAPQGSWVRSRSGSLLGDRARSRWDGTFR